jgi:hypothetical protein
VNLLRDRCDECQAEFDCTLGKPLRRLLGTDDTRIIEVARFVCQCAALRLSQIAQHDRISRRLHGTRTGSAERPPAQFRLLPDCKSVETREDDVVRHLVPLKRRPVKLNEVQGLCDLLRLRL